jgi:large conductance mechanosensitive channel protein
VDAADHVPRGREAFARRAWKDAHAALSTAGSLGGEDLERLATAAYMLGDEAEYLAVLERAHQTHAEADAPDRAVRCAFWLGLILSLRGEAGRASGWLARAQRLLGERDCVERGYLRLLETLHDADAEIGHAGAADGAEIGRRFGDADLFSLAVHEQGHCLVRLGRIEAGLVLLDEAMLAATGGELSPIATGLVYCSVIEGCQRLHELRRAQEWTAALTRWCEQQEDLVAFTGRCLVHRAEIMQVRGDWRAALAEARQAGAPVIAYGLFINNVINFLFVAFAVFVLIKGMNRLRRRQEQAPEQTPVPPRSEVLLEEIRDLLKRRKV